MFERHPLVLFTSLSLSDSQKEQLHNDKTQGTDGRMDRRTGERAGSSIKSSRLQAGAASINLHHLNQRCPVDVRWTASLIITLLCVLARSTMSTSGVAVISDWHASHCHREPNYNAWLLSENLSVSPELGDKKK